jgi:tripartite-type tricarboxylate transporter receptor subunit TctC
MKFSPNGWIHGLSLATIGRRTGVMLLVASLLFAGRAIAQPADIFTLVVPFPPGGPADAIARNVQTELQASLGRTVLIENIPGVGGALGAQKMLAAGPNGRTALLATFDETHLTPLSVAAAKYKGEDMRMVAAFSRADYALVSRPSLSMNIEQLLAHKGALSYAILGQGSIYRLAMEDLKGRTGLKATAIPYKGVVNILTDLMGGFVDVAFVPMAGNVPALIEQGKISVLAIASPTRLPLFPNVPTMNEALKATNFEYAATPGIFVHRDTAPEVVDKLHATIEKIKTTPGFKKFTEGTGSTLAAPMTRAETDALYANDRARFNAIAKAIKLEPL